MKVAMVDNEGLCSLKVCDKVLFRSARIRVADRGSSRLWKNTQAGGSISASRRAADTGTRRRAKRLAGTPASAFKE
jgi:hypothetical protein